jgi:hypothetical protein
VAELVNGSDLPENASIGVSIVQECHEPPWQLPRDCQPPLAYIEQSRQSLDKA